VIIHALADEWSEYRQMQQPIEEISRKRIGLTKLTDSIARVCWVLF